MRLGGSLDGCVMNIVKRKLVPVARTSVVRGVRRKVGRVGAPGLNPEFEALRRELLELRLQLQHLSSAQRDALGRTGDIERHMPTVLNAIASTNGTARLLRRELDDHIGRLSGDIHRVDGVLGRLSEDIHRVDGEIGRLTGDINRLDGDVSRLNGHVRDELWPLMARADGLEGLYETAAWLTNRIETVRAEMMHEIRYGGLRPQAAPVAANVEIVNAAALDGDGPVRLNLGCGHIPLDGYVNVDMRALPGVDVVAPVDNLPFEIDTVGEIFSAHVLEHFPQAALERQLLPYWHSLLVPGGTLRSVVPDIEAMIDQYRSGEISFENLRQVAYGGQEYEGDFHHTAFTPESLSALLETTGFVEIELVERGRPNGDCLEFELTARRPA